MKVLVIDDVGFNRAVMSRLLKKHGHTVIEACTGTEAVAMLEEHNDVALVLCDLLLPDFSGLDIFRRCQQIPRYCNLGSLLMPPFVMITVVTDETILAEAKQLGFADIYFKPLAEEGLLSILEHVQAGTYREEKVDNSLKILCVDPSGKIKTMLESLLSGTHHKVFFAASAAKAEELLMANLTLNLIVANFDLNETTGVALYKKWQALKRYNDQGEIPMPTYMMIADKLDNSDLIEAAQSGIQEILVRPFQPAKLEEKLLAFHRKIANIDVGPLKQSSKIMVLDDVGFNRIVLDRVLSKHGYQVFSVGSGAEAVAVFRENLDFRVIVSDLMIPDMDGVVIIKKLKEISESEKILPPDFLLVTASHDHAYIESAIRAGYAKVFTKPVNTTELMETITALMSPSDAEAPAAATP